MRLAKILFLGAALFLVALPAGAATIYVATTGSDVTGDGTQGNPYATIQFAFDQALDGDTLMIAPGTYTECVFLSGILQAPFEQRSIHLVAEAFDPSDGSTRSLTVIDGTGLCPFDSVVNIASAPDPLPNPPFDTASHSSIEGFTITGGGAGGVFTTGNVVVTNNVITGNDSAFGGAGIYIYPKACYYGTTLTTISDNLIQDNRADYDSGLGAPFGGQGGGILVRARSDEFIAGDPIGGSGCISGDPRVVIDGNTIDSNQAESKGGGVSVFTNSALDHSVGVTITQNTITGNDATSDPPTLYYVFGGGIYATTFGYGTEDIDISNNSILTNVASYYSYGGGIWAQVDTLNLADHSLTVDDNTITENSAKTGGGVRVETYARDLEFDQDIDVSVSGNSFNGNTASDPTLLGGGGGFSALYFSRRTTTANRSFTVNGNTFRDNFADRDGGGAELLILAEAENLDDIFDTDVSPSDAEITFSGNLVVENTAHNDYVDPGPPATPASDGTGGGLLIFLEGIGETVATADLTLNTIAMNSADYSELADEFMPGGITIESYTIEDSQSLGQGLAVLNINSSVVYGNENFGLGGPFLSEGVYQPGLAGGDLFEQDLQVSYSDFFGNDPNFDTSWIVDPTGFNGNLAVDPLLSAVTYVPGTCSPIVDAADPALDFSQEPDPDGGRANMGHTGGTAQTAASLADPSGDGLVDGIDVLRIAVAFGSTFGHPRWNVLADLNGDGLVDGDDLSLLVAGYGDVCP